MLLRWSDEDETRRWNIVESSQMSLERRSFQAQPRPADLEAEGPRGEEGGAQRDP